ncbi:MAG: hypothetical protein ACRDF0_06375 [Candidatus Limnocylindria bacterium]
MAHQDVTEKRTTVVPERTPGQTTNVNVNDDGTTDVQVTDDTPAGGTEVVRKETVVERKIG